MTTKNAALSKTKNAVNEHWHILGSGAMACLWAQALCRSGMTVSLITRHANATHLQSIHYSTMELEQHICEVEVLRAEQLGTRRIERLLIATKAQDAGDALRSVAESLSQQAIVLSLCNGLGIHATLQQHVEESSPNGQLFLAVSTDGAKLTSPFNVLHSGIGYSWIGHYQENRKGNGGKTRHVDLKNLLPEHLSLQHIYCDNITPLIWKKFFINCAINPLSTEFDCNNGELFSRKEYLKETLALCKELQRLYDRIATEKQLPSISLKKEVQNVAQKTAANSSSMRCDRLQGRTLEIDHLNGEAQRLAKHYHCHCPLNDALLQKLMTKKL